MPRQNTRLEAEGAEFLVLGNLLIEGIAAHKTYTNMAGYDLIAIDAERNTSARIQVKSRWRTGAEGFIINNFECDFVVIVKLNRGLKDGTGVVLTPEFYVLPVAVAKDLPRSEGWGKVSFRSISDLDSFRDNWQLIQKFLTTIGTNR